jgi:enoyl-CoA hydratase/carnithine racemase
MDARTAMDLGFATRLVESYDAMLPAARELACTMAEKNPMGLRMTKEAINCNLDCAGLEAALNMEDRNQIMISYTYRMKSLEPE